MQKFKTVTVVCSFMLCLLGIAFLTPTARADTNLVADYGFQNSRASTSGSPPSLTDIGTTSFGSENIEGSACTDLQWAADNGVSLAPTTPTMPSDKYTIVLFFKLTDVSGYRKLIDFSNGSADAGLYTLSGDLRFYPLAVGAGAPLVANTFTQVVLTRDADKVVNGYVNGVRQFRFTDTSDLGVIDANNTLRFFIDDASTNNEESAGSVARIRIYDDALSETEVEGLDRAIGTCGGAPFITFDDNPRDIQYGYWYNSVNPDASLGNYFYTTALGSSAALKFKGTAITYYYIGGPTSGKADVYIDKVKVKTICEWSPNFVPRHKKFKGLTDKKHTIEIRANDRGMRSAATEHGKPTNGSPPQISLDRFAVGDKSFEEDHIKIVLDGWQGKNNPIAYSGQEHVTSGTKSAQLHFYGTAVQVLSLGNSGTLSVNIDGNVDTVQPPSQNVQFGKLYTGLTAGSHFILISRVDGTIVLDGIRVTNSVK